MGSKYRINVLRKKGAKIGQNCFIANASFSTEPYLIEIGNHVAIGGDASLITHDGGVWIFEEEDPSIDLFGRITIGNNTFIGEGSLILPNTFIGKNCLIGAGSVVRGKIPDNSIVLGNPAKVVMSTSVFKLYMKSNPLFLKTKGLSPSQKKEIILKSKIFNKI